MYRLKRGLSPRHADKKILKKLTKKPTKNFIFKCKLFYVGLSRAFENFDEKNPPTVFITVAVASLALLAIIIVVTIFVIKKRKKKVQNGWNVRPEEVNIFYFPSIKLNVK